MRKKILIVEDDPFIAMDLEDTFSHAGFDVMGPAAQVKTSLSMIQDNLPDIAALDYNLGHETSYEIARKLESLHIPYIFVTGQIQRAINENTLEPVPLFSKPYNPETLVAKVRSMIG